MTERLNSAAFRNGRNAIELLLLGVHHAALEDMKEALLQVGTADLLHVLVLHQSGEEVEAPLAGGEARLVMGHQEVEALQGEEVHHDGDPLHQNGTGTGLTLQEDHRLDMGLHHVNGMLEGLQTADNTNNGNTKRHQLANLRHQSQME